MRPLLATACICLLATSGSVASDQKLFNDRIDGASAVARVPSACTLISGLPMRVLARSWAAAIIVADSSCSAQISLRPPAWVCGLPAEWSTTRKRRLGAASAHWRR